MKVEGSIALPRVSDALRRPRPSSSNRAQRPRTMDEDDGRGRFSNVRGFTLIEIMIVCAILAIVLTFSIPKFSSERAKEPLQRALRELTETCSHARARAILGGAPTQVVFRPNERTFSLAGGRTGGSGGGSKGSGLSGSFDESLMLEMLDINLREFKQEPLAVVTFYPNGICDELTIVLRSQENEYRKFSLEGTTGLSRVTQVDEL